MRMIQLMIIGILVPLNSVAANIPTDSSAIRNILSYKTEVLDLDDADARNKKIRLIYTLENVWDQKYLPDGIKEARLTLDGGSGFDMTNVPEKVLTKDLGAGSYEYRYTVPTGFKIKVGYVDGSRVRHINHSPENVIESAKVSESLDYNLGLTIAKPPTINGGITWSKRITYNQDEFKTTADFDQRDESIQWDIVNKSIKHATPSKSNLVYNYTNCFIESNLIPFDELPAAMRSDFKPQVGVVYRKADIKDGIETSRFKLNSAWKKKDHYLTVDVCSWSTANNWIDKDHWTEAERTISVSWVDSLYQ